MPIALAQPTLYIAHGGGPCFFMDWSSIGPKDTWDRMGAWLRGLASSLPERPKSILVISAHWEEDEFTVLTDEHPELIYDYTGFPAETYAISYPAPGSPKLADQVAELLDAAGIEVRRKSHRGFDHGVFIPFKLVFPDAEIPIIQLSLKRGLDPADHLRAGLALASLRNEGVLIVGSGMSYHNLRKFFGGGANRSYEFDAWLTETVTKHSSVERARNLVAWEKAPAAREAHPREEHLLPLMVVAGAASTGKGELAFHDEIMGQAVSAYRFND